VFTTVLVVLMLVLVVAACFVGVLLLRRIRTAAAHPTGSPGTVGDLVRRRTTPAAEPAGASRAPQGETAPAPTPLAAPTAPDTPGTTGAHPAVTEVGEIRAADVEVGDVEAGDAPWRRAARMMGSEPGAGWDTAPVPVVPAQQAADGRAVAGSAGDEPGPAAGPPSASATVAAGASTRASAGEGRTDPRTRPSDRGRAVLPPAPPVVAHGSSAVPAQLDAEVVPNGDVRVPAPTDGGGTDVAAPAVGAAPADAVVDAPPSGDPVEPGPGATAVPVGRPPTPGPRSGSGTAHVAASADAPAGDTPGEPGGQADPWVDAATPPFGSRRVEAPSRPLSDPDLTPFMGIPVVRPTVVDELTSAPSATTDPVPPPPRVRTFPRDDDEVVFLTPATPAARPVVGGSPQPVWFRVVRRDGAPVEDAVVALLDDRGQEADATKTAADGGGELRAPHPGWFLMIASAEGFQPRAVTLEVDGRPVEIALLLPRSARVAGAVRDRGLPVAGAYVVALQEGEIADEVLADRDGGYRFDDLAEGVYALSATSADGCTGHRITLSEGADLVVDLDLTPPDGAR
jgi:hypothetical protein